MRKNTAETHSTFLLQFDFCHGRTKLQPNCFKGLLLCSVTVVIPNIQHTGWWDSYLATFKKLCQNMVSGGFWWVLKLASSSHVSGRGPEDRIKTIGARGEFIYMYI